MAAQLQALAGSVKFLWGVLILCLFSLAEPACAQGLLKVSSRSMVVPALSISAEWHSLLISSAGLSELSKVQRVNAFFNQHIHFEHDALNWGQSDYWATPYETLRLGRGDCEDFAIAKYFALKKLGVATDRLRLVYVKALGDGLFEPLARAHMVLAYYKDSRTDPWVLDSLVPEIKLASSRDDLQPIFSFNTQGLWHGIGSRSSRSTLSRWQSVVQRARLEGFE